MTFADTATTDTHSAANTTSINSSDAAAADHPALQQARADALVSSLPYAGGVSPQNAYSLFIDGIATLVDVRTVEERKFVGHVPGSVHVAWQIGTALTKNPRFTRELAGKASKDAVILFLCRSGKRSAAAAEAATKAGFTNAFNVLEGFEGDIDNGQRGGNGGWRHHNLPWVQD